MVREPECCATAACSSTGQTLHSLVQAGPLDGVEPEDHEGVPVEEVGLLPPLERPGKLICIGLNYRAHAEEAGLEPPETPTFFAKFANALAAPGATVKLPPWSQRVDYEAEVAFVIGDRCKDVPAAEAMRHVRLHAAQRPVGARLPVQDAAVDARQDLRRRGALRPGARHAGRGGPPDAIEIELLLNGERMQGSSTADLVHSIPALVEYLSTLMTLEPGDLVATGTPRGWAACATRRCG